ncbi:WD40-repeat-containing domain protein [Cerioporus squamosus]|nr:WD40-repeat-containing domain protein [Cerioporus squamosus]
MFQLRPPFRRQFPPEVQEHIIDELRHDVHSLRSCALACHAWHVRSRFHLLRAIRVSGSKEIDALSSFLRAHESLRPLVESVTINSSDAYGLGPKKLTTSVSNLVCTPLFNQLPNLRCCNLREKPFLRPATATFHHSVLTYLKVHSNIETLCLYRLMFSSLTQLVGLVTSLPGLTHLVCDNVGISGRATQGFLQVTDFGPRYLRKPAKLRSLVVRNNRLAGVLAILSVAGGTVERLALNIAYPDSRDSYGSIWERCHATLTRVNSLEIRINLPQYGDEDRQPDSEVIRCLDGVLAAYTPDVLQAVHIVFNGSSYSLHRLLQNPASIAMLASLQQTILGLSLQSVIFTASTLRSQRSTLTRGLLKRSFPALYERELAKTVLPELLVGHESLLHELVVSPDGQWVASADDESLILWRTEDGSVVRDLNVPSIIGLMFTPDNQHLTICSSNRLVVRDMQPPFNVATELEHETTTCVWSPDGTLCALSGVPNGHDVYLMYRIRICRTGTLEARSTYNLTLPHRITSSWGHYKPAFSHDSRRLLFMQFQTHRTEGGSKESESITWIWDVDSTAPPRKLMNHGSPVVVSMFNPADSTQVFLILQDNTVQVRDVASGTVLISLGGEEEAGTRPWPPLCSPDGRLIATELRGGIGRLCNVVTGTVLYAGEGEGSHAFMRSWLSFSPDGTRILSTFPDAPAQLWDPHTGLPVLSLEGHINRVNAASFSPDGRYIATGYADGTVRLWNAQDGTCLAIFTEHAAAVTHFAFSPDGDIMCSAASDGTVQMRRLRALLEH